MLYMSSMSSCTVTFLSRANGKNMVTRGSMGVVMDWEVFFLMGGREPVFFIIE